MTRSFLIPHAQSIRETLFEDASLGIGNFLFKVSEQAVDREGILFTLEQEYVSPRGFRFRDLSLNDLQQVVAELAAWYQMIGTRKGDIVCTYTSEGISQFLHFLALSSLGAIAAPVNWRMKPDITLLYHQKYRFNYLVHDGHENAQELTRLAAGLSGLKHCMPAGAASPETPSGEWPVRYHEEQTVMICHSSGTTGIPKAVLFGHRQFFHGKRERLLGFMQAENEKMFSALPHSHSAGISYLMTAVLLGLPTSVQSDLTGPSLPARLASFQPTIMVSFPQTYSALASMSLPFNSFPTLRRFFNTGDTAHEAHIRALLDAAPEAAFHDGFGASELGMALFSKISTRGHIATGRCVGPAVHFASFRIEDDRGRPLPRGEVGYVAIKSRSITAGYYLDDALTARCTTPDGFWLTGDIGYCDQNGAFVHLDRAVDVIRTAFGPAYTLDLEERVLRDCPVDDVTIVGVPLSPRTTEMVVAIVHVKPEVSRPLCQYVLQTLQDGLASGVPICVVNLAPGFVPPTGATGKVLKRHFRERFWQDRNLFSQQDFQVFQHVLDNTTHTLTQAACEVM